MWANLTGVGLIITVLLLDYWVLGGRFYAPFYYWLPIAWVAWFWGWRAGAGVTLGSALLALALAWLLNEQTFPNGWFILARLGVFAIGLGVAGSVEMLRLMREYYQRSAEWRGGIRPLRVGERFILVPAQPDGAGGDPEKLDDNLLPLLLDPGTAFGSGSHPTTQMCLGLLEKYLQPNGRVFDLGCGSGVLAIAAAKLGASTVVAADIEAEAERATRANSELNAVAEKIVFRRGSLETVQPPAVPVAEQFNVTLANILAHVLLELLPAGLGRTLAPGGALILSGIKAEQAADLRQALATAGLQVVEERQQEGWVALVAKHSNT